MDETDGLEEGELIEDCDTPPILDQASLICSTREPKAIRSDESSSAKSDESDDDSDNQCSRAKRPKQRPKLPARRNANHIPNRFKVWSIAMQEESLTETLTKCDVETIDRERDVESYNYKRIDKTDCSQLSRHEMPDEEHYIDHYVDSYRSNEGGKLKLGGKRRHGDIKKRLGKRHSQSVLLPLLRVTTDDTVEEIAEDIASKLHEEKVELILNVVLVLGKERAIALYNETRSVEEKGGIMLMNGSRRRTSGGVYLFLIKGDHTITRDNMKAIFTDDNCDDRQKKNHQARKRRKKKQELLKEKLIREKLLNLNTVGANTDVPNNMDSNNLEEGEVEPEPSVSNPPPSPATDQDTPPSHTQVDGGLSDEEVEPDPPMIEEQLVDPPGRKIVSYDDADSDYVDIDVDEMDLF